MGRGLDICCEAMAFRDELYTDMGHLVATIRLVLCNVSAAPCVFEKLRIANPPTFSEHLQSTAGGQRGVFAALVPGVQQ